MFRPEPSIRARRLALALLLLASAGASRAADFHVDAAAGDDGRAGTSWAASVRTIGRGLALARAAAGADRILVAAGTYNENVVVDMNDTQLLGGWPAGGAGPRDPAANPTIVDGGGAAPVLMVSADGGLTVLRGITVDGFTFRNGNEIGRADILGAGAGVFVEEAEVVLTNNVITSNVSDVEGLLGAGMYLYRFAARPSSITNNVFENNEARNGGGGGIAIVDKQAEATSPAIELSGNTIRNNRATALPGVSPTAYAGVGGGILNWDGKVRIASNVIESNVADSTAPVDLTGQGGGLFVVDASPIITGNTISANVARGLSGEFSGSGGAFYGWWSTSTTAGSIPMAMTGNTIVDNRAEGGTGPNQAAGGGVNIGIVGDTQPELRDNTFTGNVAIGGDAGSVQGGGAFIYMRETGPAYLTITGGTFEGNSAEFGGGAAWLQGGRAGRLAMTGALVRDNRADRGSGVFLFGDGILRNLRIRENRVYDPDGDAVSEWRDNCKGLANPVQSDADGDGLGDACDADDDGDGTPDSGDACPLVAGASCAGDQDGDGDPDSADNCPTVANPGQEDTPPIDGVGDACEPAAFDMLETDAGGVWVDGDGTLTNLEIVRNVGQGLLIVGFPGDGTDPEDPSSPLVTNVTIAENAAAGFITYLAEGTRIRDSIIARNTLSDGFDTERTGTGTPSSPNMQCDDVYFWDGIASLPCTGTGNMDSSDGDTAFVSGTLGDYYLAQAVTGHPTTFVGVDAGSVAANVSQVAGLTTRIDAVADSGPVDLGYHYALSAATLPDDPLYEAVRVRKATGAVQPYLDSVLPGLPGVRWYRGDLDTLDAQYTHSTPFTGLAATPECNAPASSPLQDPDAWGDGANYYYLAVVVDGGGEEGTFGDDSQGVERPAPSDSPTDAVTNGC